LCSPLSTSVSFDKPRALVEQENAPASSAEHLEIKSLREELTGFVGPILSMTLNQTTVRRVNKYFMRIQHRPKDYSSASNRHKNQHAKLPIGLRSDPKLLDCDLV
jgi:hypothetical protein